MSVARPNTRFACIEAGRGVAAILVVIYHGARMIERRIPGAMPLGGLTGNFNSGVDFFFTLSGFIIAWTHWRDLGEPSRIGSYARKRFLRIYPPYWGVVVPLILLYLAFPAAGQPSQRDPLNIVLSIFLTPNPQQPVLGVAWTLTYEVFFYALFACIIAFGRRSLLIMPVWAMAIVIAATNPPKDFVSAFLLDPHNFDFILGVTAAVMLRHWHMPAPRVLMSVGIVVFVALLFFTPNIQATPLVAQFGFGGASALFVLGTVEMERERPVALPAIFALLGAASYAIYLIHSVALSFLALGFARLGLLKLPPDLVTIIAILLATGLGVAYHLVVEKRLTRIAKRLVGAAPKNDPTATVHDVRPDPAVTITSVPPQGDR